MSAILASSILFHMVQAAPPPPPMDSGEAPVAELAVLTFCTRSCLVGPAAAGAPDGGQAELAPTPWSDRREPATTEPGYELTHFKPQPRLAAADFGTGSAEPPPADPNTTAKLGKSYGPGTFWREASSIPLRFAGATAAISIGGFSNWKWGSSSFRFNNEGWFGKETSSLGMDKLGHAYSTYVLTEFFTDGIEKKWKGPTSSYTGAVLAMGLMTYVEVFDGFSADHGFSYEDLLVDGAGALFSIARRTIPGLRDKLDFRLLYLPSKQTWNAFSCLPAPHCDRDGAAVRGPVTDYSHQRYLLALKLSGFERFRDTPLRLLEVHGGYFARGFTKEEEDRGDPLRRRLFVGLGVNIAELLFPGRRRGLAGLAKWGLQYVQVPYTAVHSD